MRPVFLLSALSGVHGSPSIRSVPDIQASVATGLVHGHPKAGMNYPNHTGFTLTLVEEFNEKLDLVNDQVWTWGDGAWDGSQARFQKEGITFENGNMIIKIEEMEDTYDNCSYSEKSTLKSLSLRSGQLRSRHNMFRYGRYEVSMKSPAADSTDTSKAGNFFSSMVLFKDGRFKNWRQINIEAIGNGQLSTSVASVDAEGEAAADLTADKKKTVAADQSENPRDGFNEYAIEYTREKIVWYFNGEAIRTFTPDDTDAASVQIPELPMKIMMDAWIYKDDTSGGGSPDVNNYPMQAEFDWFRFYKWDQEDTYPCVGTDDSLDDSCLDATTDKYLAQNNPCDGITSDVKIKPGETEDICTTACQYTTTAAPTPAPTPTPAPAPAPTPTPPSTTTTPAPESGSNLVVIIVAIVVLILVIGFLVWLFSGTEEHLDVAAEAGDAIELAEDGDA